jgi:hypothetical protein
VDPSQNSTSLSRFFAGLAEYTFHTRLGVADPRLVDYLSRLLAKFVHTDTIYSVRGLSGRRLQEVVEMVAEAEARTGGPRRAVHRHIGDFTLFWTGVYPEALRQMQGRDRVDRLVDFRDLGKRSYWIASTMPAAEADADAAENRVLERLSREFELCAYGLGELRREWERRDGDDDTPELPKLIN